MNLLAKKGLHDLEDERWNAYGQFTYISSWKRAFPASYTNLNGSINSLLPGSERSFSGTATLYLGLKAWHGGEIYFVPEMISMRPLSDLKGLGGVIQNFEMQKGGTRPLSITDPDYFSSRLGDLAESRIRLTLIRCSSGQRWIADASSSDLAISASSISLIRIRIREISAGNF